MESSLDPQHILDPEYISLNKKLFTLTSREWDVLALFNKGLTTKEVAASLFVEIKSIENYKSRIASKLDLKGRSALVSFCLMHQDYLRKYYTMTRL